MKPKKSFQKILFAGFIYFLFIGNFYAQEKKTTDVIKIKTSSVCGMCKERIEKDMAFEKGVKDVVLDVKSQICTITYKTAKTDPQKLKLAISKIGYDADELIAEKKAYDKLPACCKKDNKIHE